MDDTFISTLIDAALEECENNFVAPRLTKWETIYVREGYVSRGWLPTGLRLPMYPAQEILSIAGRRNDVADYEVIPAEKYQWYPERYLFVLRNLWDFRNIKVQYRAGFNDTTPMPSKFKIGLLSYVNVYYDSREGFATTPMTFTEALAEYTTKFASLDLEERIYESNV